MSSIIKKSRPVIALSSNIDDYLHVEWLSGGGNTDRNQESGSCDIQSDEEPDLHYLDSILEFFCPTLNFVLYKKLLVDIIKREDRTESKWYGDYSTYTCKLVRIGDLYDKMIEMSFI